MERPHQANFDAMVSNTGLTLGASETTIQAEKVIVGAS
jgi:hypothetical protein